MWLAKILGFLLNCLPLDYTDTLLLIILFLQPDLILYVLFKQMSVDWQTMLLLFFFWGQIRHKLPPVTVGHFPDEVCRYVWVGMQNWPLSAFDGEWQVRLSVPWGLCSGPGDRELPYIPRALGRCVILWPFGKVATLQLSPPQASGASISSFVVVLIRGRWLTGPLLYFWVEATWCVLNDQPDHSSLAFS